MKTENDLRAALARHADEMRAEPGAWRDIEAGVTRARRARALSVASGAMAIISAMAMVVSLAGPGAGGSGLVDFAGNAVEAGTFKMRSVTENKGRGLNGEERTYSVTTTGEFDLRRKVGRFVMEMKVPEGFESELRIGGSRRTEMIITEEAVYMRDSAKGEWYRLSSGEQQSLIFSHPLSPVADPVSSFERLEDLASNVSLLGRETIGGRTTDKYRLDLDLAKVIASFPEEFRDDMRDDFEQETSVFLWVGADDGLPYREQVAQGANLEVFTVDFYDYGEPVSIDVPSEDEVKPYPSPTAVRSTFSCTATNINGVEEGSC